MFRQAGQSTISPLEYGDASMVRLPWDSRFSAATLRSHLDEHPRLAFWTRATGEYAVGGFWRGRRDIGMIVETSKGRSQALLVDALVSRFRGDGFSAVMLSQDEVGAAANWYLQRGWCTLDRLLVFRLAIGPPEIQGEPRLSMSPFRRQELPALTELDRAAFPWLWWNEPSDFLEYASSSNVGAFLGFRKANLVGYVSYSTRNGRGHLDRLAVRPSSARKGYGSWLLAFVLSRMWQSGVREVALTTQETNQAAQKLYRRFGFVETGEAHEVLGQELCKP